MMSIALPPQPRTRTKVLALRVVDAAAPIREAAWADMTTKPVLGCRCKRNIVSRYDRQASRPSPFEGERLGQAIWNPRRRHFGRGSPGDNRGDPGRNDSNAAMDRVAEGLVPPRRRGAVGPRRPELAPECRVTLGRMLEG